MNELNSCDVQENAEMSDAQSDDVEPYILVKDESNNITIFKGNSQIFLPQLNHCTEHSDLFLLEDDTLVKPGDKFATHDDFVQYINENAKRWCFYYKCVDSRKATEQESYLYTCIYLKNKEKYVKKGIRKRTNNLKTDCPCKIKLRRLPNEDELTVVFVCNHHDHPLSEEEFFKLQHGRRLPPFVREEIMDMLALKVSHAKIRKYVHMETGFKMSHSFFYTLERNMKTRNIKRDIPLTRFNELSEKIKLVDATYDDDEDYTSKKLENSLKNRKRINFDDSPDYFLSEDDLQESFRCSGDESIWNDECEQKRSPKKQKSKRIRTQKYNMSNNDHGTVEDSITENSIDENYIAYETVVADEETNVDSKKNTKSVKESNDLVTEIIGNDDNAYVISEYVEDGESITYIYSNQTIDPENGTIGCIDSEGNVVYKNNTADGTTELIDYNSTEVIEYLEDVEGISENDPKPGTSSAQAQENGANTPNSQVLPVFDVYMKDGNVTGFVLNDDAIHKLRNDASDKAVQTEDNISEPNLKNMPEFRKSDAITEKVGDTILRHEYIHKYNIDKYMLQPYFPKYIEMLSKELRLNVLQMFTNIYLEKAMFKMTTTQKGKEGNTKIFYLTNTPRTGRRSGDVVPNGEESGRLLVDVLLLREKVRELKRKNQELVIINKQLEELTHANQYNS